MATDETHTATADSSTLNHTLMTCTTTDTPDNGSNIKNHPTNDDDHSRPPTPPTSTSSSANEDFSNIPPATTTTTAAKPSFFSRMSSLGSTAAPLLEQVYDRAHKRAVALKEHATAAHQDAVHMVRITSVEVARDLDTAVDLHREDDARSSSSEEESASESQSDESFSSLRETTDKSNADGASVRDDDEADETPTERSDHQRGEDTAVRSPLRFLSAYTEFRTTGRYQRKRDDAPQSHAVQDGPWYESSPVVGGADRVAGLGRLKLHSIVTMVGKGRTSDVGDEEDSASAPDGMDAPPTEHVASTPSSPMTRPMKRTHSHYEEAVKHLLAPNQRALFFGKGTMGVILKPTYLASWRGKDGGGLVSSSPASKRGGVFIDALVPGGHAERSGVVFVGDRVVKIGNVDVSQMTLEEVVKAIAEAERPNIMVLMAEWEVITVKRLGEEEERRYFVSPLDLAFGFVNKIAVEGIDLGKRAGAEQMRKEERMHAGIGRNSLLDDDDDDDNDCAEGHDHENEEEVLFSSENMGGDLDSQASSNKSLSNVANKENDDDETPNESNPQNGCNETDGNSTLPISTTSPSSAEFDALVMYASQRTNGRNEASLKKSNSHKRHRSLATVLARAAFLNPNFRNTLHEAFKECCTDARRASFLEHYFLHFMTKKEVEINSRNEQEKQNGHKNIEYHANDSDPTSSTNQRKLLEIYMDLLKFRDVVKACSDFDRENLLEYARTVSSKFIIDDGDSNMAQSGNTLPEYVVYVAFGGTECVQSLKRALADEDEFFEEAEGDGFYKIREALGSFLSTQEPFLTFLVSDDCARMRAYLRGTAPFVCVEPSMFLNAKGATDSKSRHLLLFAVLHLVCMKENLEEVESSDDYGEFIKMDAMIVNQKGVKRVIGAASILSCPIFIMRTLNQSLQQAMEGLVEDEMTGSRNNTPLYKALADDVKFLWENFVSPISGALALLNLSDDTKSALDAVRGLIPLSLDGPRTQGAGAPIISFAKLLTSVDFSSALQVLSDALIRDYCTNIFPNFRRHIFHEWALAEIDVLSADSPDFSRKINEYLVDRVFNGISRGCSRKVLRQIELPRGLSLHLPASKQSVPVRDDFCGSIDTLHNADIAVVFATQCEQDEGDASPKSATSDSSAESTIINSSLRRLSCVSLQPEMHEMPPPSNCLTPADIPDTFEEYMFSPPFCERPFQGMLRQAENNRMSIDGWEVSLSNIMIPVGKGSSDMLYCVSLTLSNVGVSSHAASSAERCLDDQVITDLRVEELYHDPDYCKSEISLMPPQCDNRQFRSTLFEVKSADRSIRKIKVPCDLKKFSQQLKQQISLITEGPKKLVGISLVSNRNVIPAMRHTLSLLYDDLCSLKSNSGLRSHGAYQYVCRPLLDLLNVLSCPTIEESSLKCILAPYISYATSRWIHRPVSDQSKQLTESCGMQLIQSLPPVPLALLFVTILLEQKVVLSSSRRSMLLSASVAITELLRPLKWTHLLVPHTPISMVNDLLHYPAPFILGLSTDEKKSANILRSLPPDVTLVDLDVGRVMLASVFVYDDATKSNGTMKESSRVALRSQSLVLAEFLGGIFGSAIYQESWCCESPQYVNPREWNEVSTSEVLKFAKIRNICCDFLTELTSGE
eukprot:CCRYP_016637-RA/>CCRYP_016637-RA protein AED:0.01 eAED:0.01 QI:87/1/1/1/1/1/3/866/1626